MRSTFRYFATVFASALVLAGQVQAFDPILPVSKGGTASSSLGNNVTNTGGIFNTKSPADRNVSITSDTITSADCGATVVYSSASSTAISIASAASAGLTQGCSFTLNNAGAGTATMTPTTSTINGAATLAIPPNTGCSIRSNTVNYLVDLSACTAVTGPPIITSSSATALAVGQNGATNPALSVDASTASSATGVKITSAAANNGVTITSTSSAADETLTIQPKGNGFLYLNGIQSSLRAGAVDKFTATANINTIAAGQRIVLTTGAVGSSSTRFLYTAAADFSLPASVEANDTYFNLGQSRQFTAGALTLQRDFRLTGSTYTATSASTFTDVAAFGIDGAPTCSTNMTCTNASALYIPTKALTNTGTGYGINIAAPSGATNNYAAKIAGDIVFTGSAPTISTCGSGAIVTGSTDHKGQVSGITAATACTITFSQALGTAPACTFTTNSAITPSISTISTSAVTTTMTALTGTLYYICF